MTKARTKLSITDVIVCIVAAVVAIILLIIPAKSSGNTVFVKTDSDEFTFDISKDSSNAVTSNGHNLTVEIKNGEVFVKESDCKDNLCVAMGHISDSTKVIVCAPAKVIIRILDSGEKEDADFIAGR